MTCIVGIQDKEGVVLGCDSASCTDSSIEIAGTKIVVHPAFAMGFTTAWRFGQLLERAKIPKLTKETPRRYLIDAVVPALQKELRDSGWLKVEDRREETGSALIACGGILFELVADWSIVEKEHGYSAVGAGTYFALGSLFSTKRQKSESRVLTALEAAELHSPWVRRPFYLHRVAK